MKGFCPLHRQAIASPNQQAVHSSDVCLTWSELDQITSSIAKTILKPDSKESIKVPIAVHRCDPVVSIVLICSAFKASRRIVVLSDKEPPNRVEKICQHLNIEQCFQEMDTIQNLLGLNKKKTSNDRNKSEQISEDDHRIKSKQISEDDHRIKSKQITEDDHRIKSEQISKDGHLIKSKQISEDDHRIKSKQISEDDHRIKSEQISEGDHLIKSKQISEGDHLIKSKQISEDDQRIKSEQLIEFDLPTIYLLTSGSTREPKIVAHSMRTLLAAAQASNGNISFQVGDRWLLSLSLWHIGGLAILFRALCGGGCVVISKKKTPLAQAIEKNSISHLSVVALQLQRILDANHATTGLKHVLVGGGPVPEQLIKDARQADIPVHTTYGMTELGSQMTTTPIDSSMKMLVTAGKPLKGWEIKIALDNEIYARGEALFLGYLQDQKIIPSRDEDGWFHTGDVGKILENGCLIVLGRKDAQFISGGENIYPEEIEQILTNFSPIQLAIVVPIPSRAYGYRPAAFIMGSFSEAKLRKYLEYHLPKFKHPDVFLPWPSHISTHKPSRSALLSIALQSMKQKP